MNLLFVRNTMNHFNQVKLARRLKAVNYFNKIKENFNGDRSAENIAASQSRRYYVHVIIDLQRNLLAKIKSLSAYHHIQINIKVRQVWNLSDALRLFRKAISAYMASFVLKIREVDGYHVQYLRLRKNLLISRTNAKYFDSKKIKIYKLNDFHLIDQIYIYIFS